MMRQMKFSKVGRVTRCAPPSVEGSFDFSARVERNLGFLKSVCHWLRGGAHGVTRPTLASLLAGSVFVLLSVSTKTAADEPIWASKQNGWAGAVTFSAEGSLLASGHSDGTIRIQLIANTKKSRVLKVGPSPVGAVAFSPLGKTLASGTYDGAAQILELKTGKRLFDLERHKGGVLSVAFSPDGQVLATGGIDATIWLWNTGTGIPFGKLDGHKSWVNAIAFDAQGILYSAGSDGLIKIWSSEKNRAIKTIDATNTEIRSLAVSKDGRKIAAGLRYGTVKLWVDGAEQISVKSHQGDAWSVAFSNDGQFLVSGGGDWKKPGDIKIWTLEGNKSLTTLSDNAEILSVAISPDGSYIASASGDGSVKIWRR